MNLQKSTRYALIAAVEMAGARGRLVTVADVSARYAIPPNALAKVLQQLVRAGVATGTRGVGGGYRLARPASEVSVLEVVGLFEAPRAAEGGVLGDISPRAAAAPAIAGLHHLFEEVDEFVRCTYASVSLETLLRAPAKPPAASPRPSPRASRRARA